MQKHTHRVDIVRKLKDAGLSYEKPTTNDLGGKKIPKYEQKKKKRISDDPLREGRQALDLVY